MKGLGIFWKGLTPQQQLVVIVLIIIAIWMIRTYLIERRDTIKRVIQEKTEIQVLEEQGVKASYSYSTYESYADDLFAAMDGPGTEIPKIYSVMGKMKNDADIIQLEKAFGVRLSSYSSSWFTDPSDLKDWLRSDLSESTMSNLNKQLSRQGISKRF